MFSIDDLGGKEQDGDICDMSVHLSNVRSYLDAGTNGVRPCRK